MRSTQLPEIWLDELTLEGESAFLDAMSRASVEKWYHGVRPILDSVDLLVRDSLDALQQLAPYEVAFTKTRVKGLRSTLEKIQKVVVDGIEATEGGKVSVFSAIRDLVGGRVVFYFEPDRRIGFDFFHEDPRFFIEEVFLYEALHAESHLHHASLPRLVNRIQTSQTNLREFVPTVRDNGYESLHLIVSLEHDLLPVRSPDRAAMQRLRRLNEALGKIRIEIQLRSMLQDLWAQPEHGFSYVARKSKFRSGMTTTIHDLSDSAFHTHKLLVKAVERYHSTIWDSFRYSKVPSLKQLGSSLGPRIRDAEIPEPEATALERLDAELETSPDTVGLYRRLEEVYDRLDASGDPAHSIWSLKLPRSAREWLRHRILLLFLGYLVSVKGDPAVVDTISARIGRVDARASANRYDLARQIYVLIKTGDAWFVEHARSAPTHPWTHDPLVSYRLSGVFLLDSPPNYFRGLEELRRAVDDYDRETQHRAWSAEGDPILNAAHLHRRLAKFCWYHFLSKDRDTRYLDEACAHLAIAHQTGDVPGGAVIASRERQKILYDTLTIEFFRTVLVPYDLREKGSAADGTSDLDPIWEEGVRAHFNKAVQHLKAEMEDSFGSNRPEADAGNAPVTSHEYQASSIAAWAGGDIKRARTAIVDARASLRNSDERPLVRDVIRQVETFLVLHRAAMSDA